MRKNKGIMLITATLVGMTIMLSGCSKDDEKQTETKTETTTVLETTTEAVSVTEAVSETETETETTTAEETTTAAASDMKGMSLESLAEKLQATGGYSNMFAYPSDDLMDYYGIDISLCDEYVFYVSDTSPKADTIALFNCKSKEATDEMAQKLEGYLSYLAESTKDYAPEEYEKTTNTGVRSFGNFVELIITADQKSSQEVLDEYISANCE